MARCSLLRLSKQLSSEHRELSLHGACTCLRHAPRSESDQCALLCYLLGHSSMLWI